MSVWEVEDRDGIIVAAHNNPPMNYFIGASAAGLAEMLPRWREPDVRVVILTGAIPDRYITHYSVEELVDLAEDREDLHPPLLRPDLRLAHAAAVARRTSTSRSSRR